MDALIPTFLDFVERHAHLIFWLSLLFALAETTLIVSLIIPSTAILVGLGALAATGRIDIVPLCLGAGVGALLGSTLSYLIGWRWGNRMLRVWPLSRDPATVDRAADSFARRGAVTLLVGHFVGPLRSVVFVMAGAARMPAWHFHPWNAGGALAWAVTVPLAGQAGGSALGWLWTLLPGGA